MSWTTDRRVGLINIKGQKQEDSVNKYNFLFGAVDLLCNEIYFKLFLINENKELMPLYISESQRIQKKVKFINKSYIEWKQF